MLNAFDILRFVAGDIFLPLRFVAAFFAALLLFKFNSRLFPDESYTGGPVDLLRVLLLRIIRLSPKIRVSDTCVNLRYLLDNPRTLLYRIRYGFLHGYRLYSIWLLLVFIGLTSRNSDGETLCRNFNSRSSS